MHLLSVKLVATYKVHFAWISCYIFPILVYYGVCSHMGIRFYLWISFRSTCFTCVFVYTFWYLLSMDFIIEVGQVFLHSSLLLFALYEDKYWAFHGIMFEKEVLQWEVETSVYSSFSLDSLFTWRYIVNENMVMQSD